MGSSRRVSSNAAKRRNAHNSAVYCSTFLALSRIAPGSIDSRCRKTFSVMPPFLDVPFCAGLDGQSGCVTGRDDGVSTGFAKLFTASIRRVQRSRLARARTVPPGVPMLRAISRSRMPEAKAVLSCSHVSADLWQRVCD